MRRIAIWIVAIVIALAAGSGVSNLFDARLNGWTVLFVFVTWLAFEAFVAALVVTALDSLIPARRRVRRR